MDKSDLSILEELGEPWADVTRITRAKIAAQDEATEAIVHARGEGVDIDLESSPILVALSDQVAGFAGELGQVADRMATAVATCEPVLKTAIDEADRAGSQAFLVKVAHMAALIQEARRSRLTHLEQPPLDGIPALDASYLAWDHVHERIDRSEVRLLHLGQEAQDRLQADGAER